MITVTIIGSYEGDSPNKSHPDKAYLYVRPMVQPPAGVLRSVRCVKDFGAPEEATMNLGTFAVICFPQQLPQGLEIGEKIALTANCWPVVAPIWSEREKNIVMSSNINHVLVLTSEVRPVQTKAVPATFDLNGYYAHRLRKDETHSTFTCTIDDAPPSWLLRDVQIRRGKGYVPGRETISAFEMDVPIGTIPGMAKDTPVRCSGQFWPVSDPYYSAEQGRVAWRKVSRFAFYCQQYAAEPVGEKTGKGGAGK